MAFKTKSKREGETVRRSYGRSPYKVIGSRKRAFPKFLIIDRMNTLKAIKPEHSDCIERKKKEILKATTAKKQNKIYADVIERVNK